ncbi:MAG: glucans biosynthesis glucosyltransferase MdoH [Acetobacteraceae bacterium]|nr:glucans biosynthesis glucosyltransferase MdoH [Acetobacteraceae bacterium]
MNISPVSPPARLGAAGSFEVTPLRDANPLWPRRAAFVGPVAAFTLAGTALATVVTTGDGLLRPVLLALVALNLLYIGLTGWPAVLGFLLHVFRRKLRVSAASSGQSRTALLMPVYNENPRVVFAAVEAMGRAIADAGLERVDLFVLSDTQDPAIAAAEASEFALLQARLPAGPGLVYRRRQVNTSRKVGNLLDFCATWGAQYDYMVVLDADSLMGPSSIATLIGLMDANPKTGIIQTVPYAVGRETPFARMLQFSARLYTPLLVEGLTFWQQGDGNYWGHNAIIRVAPFHEHCRLPILPGREPWGGEILCHDVVEAGLMRAAGWHVWMLPETLESFEALPANMVDFASRERRWCQGNLQHKGVLADPRLRPLGRYHLAYGITHYLAGPAAAAFLLLATADATLGGRFATELLLEGGPAQWTLVALSAFMLYACKVTSLIAVLVSRKQSRLFGGRLRLLASAVLEQLGALVITGVLIACYASFVLDLVRGRSVRWEAQPRDDRGLSWAEAWTRLRLPTLAGAAWLTALSFLDDGLLLWCAPLLLGLLLSVPVAVWSSRLTLGRLARRAGLFLTPEEVAPAAVTRAYQRLALTPEPATSPRAAAPSLQLAD